MDANLMSAQELMSLAYKKQQEERDRLAQECVDEDKVVKIGYLKHNLYEFPGGNFDVEHYCSEYFFPEEEITKLVDKFKEEFAVIAKKGSKFICYIYDDEESWYEE